VQEADDVTVFFGDEEVRDQPDDFRLTLNW
jgi:hypothetical protein